jgi:cyclophilin family peptidyl-prolyl cis-trans isomerase
MKRIASILVLIMAVSMAMQAQSTKVLLKTSMGDITLMLYDDTPMHKDNFIKLVNDKFYDGLLFHRVMNNFMIQAGDPGSKNAGPEARLGSGGPGYTIPAEFRPNHWHKKGALAAARRGQGNPNKESSGSQFYIVQGKKWTPGQLDMMESQGRPKFTPEQRTHYTQVGGYAPLDFEYTVFGEVTEGLDVVDKIAAVQVNQANRPVKDVKIISAKVINSKTDL